MQAVVAPAQLAALLKRLGPRGRLVNASLSPTGDSRAVFDRLRVAGAEFWDVAAIRDRSSPLPNTLMQPYELVDFVAEKRMKRWDVYVLYDDFGLVGAARLYWILSLLGRQAVVVNARLPELQRAGVLLTAAPPTPRLTAKNVNLLRFFFRAQLLADYEDVTAMVRRNRIEGQENRIVDARAPQLFNAVDGEGVPAHIPTSRNLHYRELLTPEGLLRPAEELRAALQPLQLASARRIVVTCGSGMTASVLFLALRSLGYDNVALYDGSWTEFSARSRAEPKG